MSSIEKTVVDDDLLDLEELDGPIVRQPLQVRRRPTRQRITIAERLEKNKVVVESPRITSTEVVLPIEAKQPFWDKRSVVFVSWYWPTCVVIGLALGLFITYRLI